MKPNPSWLALLELPPDAQVELLGESSPPPSSVGQGFVLQPVDFEQLSPSYSEVLFASSAALLGDLGVDVRRSDDQSSVVRFTAPTDDVPIEVWSGRSKAHTAGDVAVDSGIEAAVVVLPTSGGWLTFHVERGRVEAARVQTKAAFASLTHTPDRTRPAVPELPPLDALLEGLPAASWLTSEYLRLSGSPSLVDRGVALGVVARCWEPTTPEARRVSLAWLEEGRGTHAGRVADWLTANQGSRFAARLLDQAVGRASSLLDRARSLADLASQLGDDEMAACIGSFRGDRDDLACVRDVLVLAGIDPGELDEILVVVDRLAQANATLLDDLGPALPSERAAAAARERPGVWWTRSVR